MYTITKDFSFSASHRLPLVPEGHPCGEWHGHNYVVTVALQAESLARGFVMDYREMGRFKEWVDGTLDHRCLNDVWENPTAENMARAMFLLVQGWGWPVAWVEVSETPKTVARYHPKE